MDKANTIKIVFVIPSLAMGGAEKVFVNLAKNLDRSIFTVYFIVASDSCDDLLVEIPEFIKLIRLPFTRVLWAVPQILLEIRKIRPFIVFSTLSHMNLALAMCSLFLPGGSLLIARESTILSRSINSYKPEWLWRKLFCFFYKKIEIIVAQSQEMKRDLCINFKVPEQKIVVIHNPVDFISIREKSRQFVELPIMSFGKKILVSVGMFRPEKNFMLLLEALSLLDPVRFHLLLIGDGTLKSELVDLADKLEIADRVTFIGFQANPFPWLKQADAFILSSSYEGFPNVVLEALACEIPVIATPAVGGLFEIIEGVNGCFVAEAISSRALVEAILRWDSMNMGKIDSNVISKFELDKIVASYQDLFLDLKGGSQE